MIRTCGNVNDVCVFNLFGNGKNVALRVVLCVVEIVAPCINIAVGVKTYGERTSRRDVNRSVFHRGRKFHHVHRRRNVGVKHFASRFGQIDGRNNGTYNNKQEHCGKHDDRYKRGLSSEKSLDRKFARAVISFIRRGNFFRSAHKHTAEPLQRSENSLFGGLILIAHFSLSSFIY